MSNASAQLRYMWDHTDAYGLVMLNDGVSLGLMLNIFADFTVHFDNNYEHCKIKFINNLLSCQHAKQPTVTTMDPWCYWKNNISVDLFKWKWNMCLNREGLIKLENTHCLACWRLKRSHESFMKNQKIYKGSTASELQKLKIDFLNDNRSVFNQNWNRD
jgi:hypothetical protein